MGKRIRAVVAAISAVLLPLAAGSEELEQWVPGVAVVQGVFTEKWNVHGSSDVRNPFSGSSNVVSPLVGVSAELMTPSLSPHAGKPRFFVHGDVETIFDSEWSPAKEGSPGSVSFPIIDLNGDGIPDAESSVKSATGTGSVAQHETERLRLSAGLGVAFAFELLGRTVRVRPSVDYQWQRTEVRMLVSDAESLDGGLLCPCRILELSSREMHTFHGVGPSLELELDAGRVGPFSISVFSGVQSYRVLGTRKVRVIASDTSDDGKPASAEARFAKDPWSFNGRVGLRFRWLPEG
jgi:hypothetical protein